MIQLFWDEESTSCSWQLGFCLLLSNCDPEHFKQEIFTDPLPETSHLNVNAPSNSQCM